MESFQTTRSPSPLLGAGIFSKFKGYGLYSQFACFCIVGAVGFLADTASVYVLRAYFGLYIAGAAAYFIAATVTWVLNRNWTFKHTRKAPAYRQWAHFLIVNLFGFVFNRGAYIFLIWKYQLCETYPVIAIAAGAIIGMLLNFSLSRTFVFRRP